MSFLTPQFFCFFPVTVLVYFLLPQRFRNLWLLLASWFFYLCAKPVYLLFLLFAILFSYLFGRLLERKRSRGGLALCLVLLFSLLFVFKYLNFSLSLLSRALAAAGFSWSAPVLDLLLPVGISFYLFQAAGYVIDVYRGKVPAQRDFLLYALFLSFFPQLLSGPIARADSLLPQLRRPHRFDYDALRIGLLRFLWGAFKKLVIADRLSLLVDTVYAAPDGFGALQLIGAALAYSLQIYCDFSAYSDMALGCAKAMGFSLMENFRTPYFSRSIAEFWRRWHISLSSWFRDYLYIPLGGSRRGMARKYLNVLVVFAVSGLWHGAGLTFLVWGLLNGLYQVLGALTAPARNKVRSLLPFREDGPLVRLFQIALTFILTTVAWVFFRAGSLSQAIAILSGMLHGPLWVFTSVGLDAPELLVAAGAVLLLLLVDLRSLSHDLPKDYLALSRVGRWLVLLTLFFACLIFGVYGDGFNAQSFIYGFSF